MKFTIEVDTERCPDAVGEYLRSEFFAEDPNDPGSVGCYTTHEWRNDVEPLDPAPVHPHTHPAGEYQPETCDGCIDPDWMWTRGRKNGIECRWYWDGDGTLEFVLPRGEVLSNSDCKKSHGWELEQPSEETSIGA